MAEEQNFNPPVMIIGESGEGKSSMFGANAENGIKGLPPERTIILCPEEKFMQSDNAKDFTVKMLPNYRKFKATLEALSKPFIEKEIDGVMTRVETGSRYDYVVIDSLTSVAEKILLWAEYAHQGFEQWKQYNSAMYEILMLIKRLPQQVFVVGIPEYMDESFNNKKAFFKIKGKELKYGQVEKEFSMVLFTKPVYNDDGEVTDVELQYKPNKFNTAKSPSGMFKKRPKNDARDIVLAIRNYYGVSGKKEESSDSAN